MKTNFLENNHVVHCAPSGVVDKAEDLFEDVNNCDVMSLANADGAVFIAVTMARVATGGNATLYVYACDDTTPTTTVAVSFRYQTIKAPDTIISVGESKGLLTSLATDMIYVLEVDAAKVAEQGYKYVHMQSVELTNQAMDGAIFGFLTGLRYKEDDAGTQVT